MSSREVAECSWVWPIRLYKCRGTWQSSPGVVVDLSQPIPKPSSVSAPQRKIVEVYRTLWRLCLVEPETSSGEKVFWILGIWGFGCSMIFSWKSSCWKISGCWGSIEIGLLDRMRLRCPWMILHAKNWPGMAFLRLPVFDGGSLQLLWSCNYIQLLRAVHTLFSRHTPYMDCLCWIAGTWKDLQNRCSR